MNIKKNFTFKLFLNSILLLLLVVSNVFFLFPETTKAAKIGCCIIETDLNNKYVKTNSCITTDESLCTGSSTKKAAITYPGQTSSTSKLNNILQLKLPSCAQCNEQGSFKTAILEKDYCCVEVKSIYETSTRSTYNVIESCKIVASGTKSCPNGSVLYKQTCGTISLRNTSCSQVSNVQKATKQALEDERNAKLNKIKEELETNQIKPVLSTKIPGTSNEFDSIYIKNIAGSRYISVPFIAQYIGWIYQYAIGIAGVIAVIMIMIGGLSWILSAGDTTKISNAKDKITSAIFGLALVMSAYLIANFINPALLNPSELLLEIPEVKETPVTGTSATSGISNAGSYAKCKVKEGTNLFKEGDGSQYCIKLDQHINLSTKQSEFKNIVVPSNKYKGTVTPKMYKMLLKLDKLIPTVTPSGTKMYMSNTSRSVSRQIRFCNCWQSFLESGKTVCPKGCGPCNLAGGVSCTTSSHKSASAMDVTFSGGGLKCGSSMKNNCADQIAEKHKSTLSKQLCAAEPKLAICQNLLATTLRQVGFKTISSEWWHFDVPNTTCDFKAGVCK